MSEELVSVLFGCNYQFDTPCLGKTMFIFVKSIYFWNYTKGIFYQNIH